MGERVLETVRALVEGEPATRRCSSGAHRRRSA
ncbi:hypothetical protein [Curtobacterium pusillum]